MILLSPLWVNRKSRRRSPNRNVAWARGLVFGSTSLFCVHIAAADRPGLRVVPELEPVRVFAGRDRLIRIVLSNPTDQEVRMDVVARLYQLTSATAVRRNDTPWKRLRILPGQTVIETAFLSFPSVTAPTSFAVQWLGDSGRRLGRSLILGECGFRLTDDRSNTPASIELVGDALSEFGMRRGNLVTCTARVEIKVRALEGGTILRVDRQTSVAVDVAEQIAAKTALQNAALALAERIIPLIVK